MTNAHAHGKRPMSRDRVVFNLISYLYLGVLSAVCLLPFLLVISGSFTEQYAIQLHGYRLIPETFSLDAYRMLFRIPEDILRAYGVTILVTVVGTVVGLLFTSMAAYVLASPDFKYRYQVSFFFYFTSIFGGGLVPWYIFCTKYLHFHNRIISMILPIMINVTYLLILKSYMMGIPSALYESARLDGASDLTIFFKIAIPLSKAGLATVGLFLALNYCLQKGIPVGSEVGGAYTLNECYRLVQAWETTRTPYMLLENCIYGRRERMVLNMVRKGLFGEIMHCAGGYCHDLREEIAGGRENRHYRLNEYLTRNCENYPSHALGPIMRVLDINRSNRMLTLSSTASKAAGLHAYCLAHRAGHPQLCDANFAQGDIVTTVITCSGGQTITLTLDTTLPRPYSRGFTVRGTKGMYQEDNDSVFLNGCHSAFDFAWNRQWGNAEQYAKEYDDPLWAAITEEERAAGHGGMDYLCCRDFFDHLRSNEPMPIDVYDAAAILCITPLSEQSIAAGGQVVEIPCFRGKR